MVVETCCVVIGVFSAFNHFVEELTIPEKDIEDWATGRLNLTAVCASSTNMDGDEIMRNDEAYFRDDELHCWNLMGEGERLHTWKLGMKRAPRVRAILEAAAKEETAANGN